MKTLNNYSIQVHCPGGTTKVFKLKKAIPGEQLYLLDTLAKFAPKYKFYYQYDNCIKFGEW